MKVLHLISSGGMYGAEAVILQLCAAMNESGQHASFLGVFAHTGKPTPALHEAALRAGIHSELIACKGQVDGGVPGAIRALAARLGADVIHAHGYKADIYTYAAFRDRTPRPALVSTCHTWYDNDLAVRIYGAADRWTLKHFDQVVAVSVEVKNRLLKAGVRAEKVDLIRNGIDTGPFGSTGRVAGDSAEAVRVGLVGRLAPEKGVDIFLRACAEVAGRRPQATFVVAGDGPDRAALENLAQELGLTGRFRFLGQQPEMLSFYASLDLLVSASRQEGLPMALLEGMASSLPLVATRVGEVPGVVVDGRTGILVEPESPEALARGMEQLIGDVELRRAYGKAGRQRIVDEFSAQRMTQEYLGAYRKAVMDRRDAGTPRKVWGRSA